MQRQRLISDIKPAQNHRSNHHMGYVRRERPKPVGRTVSDFSFKAATPVQASTTPQAHTKTVHPKPQPDLKTEVQAKEDSSKLTISEHLQEFRKRLIISLLALFIGGTLGYIYRDQIFAVLIKPLNQELYYTNPAGGFEFMIKICIFAGFLLAIPVLVYQLIKFLGPAVPKRVMYKTSRIVLVSVLLAIAGACFAYFISLPAALHFLNNFSSGPINSLITANEYLNFVMIYMVGFAALFQMPLILYFINKITPLSPKMLMSKQRVVILGSFIVAAILTPTPDPFNQVLMAAPMIMLYQSSIGVVWTANRKNRGNTPKEQTLKPALA